MKKKALTVSLICCMFWLGCGGREAHPVAAYQPGDSDRSCEGLRLEIAQLNADMAAKEKKTSKAGKNVLCFVTGCFIIVPWFFIDLKNADKTEYEAMDSRLDRLTLIAGEKKCDIKVPDATSVNRLGHRLRLSNQHSHRGS